MIRLLLIFLLVRLRRTLPVSMFVLCAASAFAQRQHIRFNRLGPESGLSQSNVTCILQDSRGFMWFGTRDGLNQYDGVRFTIYHNVAGDSGSLSNSYVTSLAEDRKGNIWIGTWGGGLNRFDPSMHRFTRFPLGDGKGSRVATDFINTLRMDSRGRLWIGMDGAGLDVMDPMTGQFRNTREGLADNDVTAFCEDDRHGMWIGTFRGGLCRMAEGGTLQRYMHAAGDPGSLANNSIYCIFQDSRHRLFVGTRGGGLDRLDASSGDFVHYRHEAGNPKSLAHDDVAALGEDPEGHLWAGTENGGLSVLDAATDEWHSYAQDDIDNSSLANNSIDYICRDRQGNMWLGTYSGGVNVFMKDANLFTTFRHNGLPGSLGNNNVLYLLEDRAGTVWIATDGGGLESMDPATGVITSYRHSADAGSMGGNYVLSIHEDADGRIWAGTWGDGLSVLDKKTGRFLHYRNRSGDSSSLGGNNIYSIARDGGDDLWLGAYGNGLDRYDRRRNSFVHFRHDPHDPKSLSSDRIHTLLAVDDGLWVGTFDGGLDCLNKRTGIFKHYIHSDTGNSLSNNSVNCIYEDRRHSLWIGTGDGLNRLDPATGHFTIWRTPQGLPNNMVFGIVEDRNGMLWISTNKGLSRMDPATGIFQNYTSAEGLQGDEFKPHSCLRSRSGRLYFGGIAGFNEFDPDSIRPRATAAPLVITGFQLFNREVPVSTDSLPTPLARDISETNDVTLGWSNSVMSFEFVTLNYAAPGRNRYAYQLVGFDTGWNYIGSRRMATYTHLEPGSYVLKIKAGTADGSWGEQLRSLAIRITPPFWKTWWFRVLLVMILVAAIGCVHAIRLRSLQAQKKKLEAQVASLLDRAVAQGKHELASEVLHDIGNAIIGFSGYITRIKRLLEGNKTASLEQLAGFFRDHRREFAGAIGEEKAGAMIQLVEGIVRARKEEQEELNKVVGEQYNSTTRIQEILHIQRQYISGTESQERKPVLLAKLVSDAVAMLAATLQKNSISIVVEPAPESFVVKGDRTRLMQLMLNLLKNSIEALEHSSFERIIRVRLLRNAEGVQVEIRDNGIGFDEPTGSRLFVRGFTTKPTGSGVGLHHCRTILDSHNGRLELSSEGAGKGCVAIVSFQAA